jgi:hypothetical protein
LFALILQRRTAFKLMWRLYQAALHGLRPDNVRQYYELVNGQWGANAARSAEAT